VRRTAKRALVQLAGRLTPPLYASYLGLVWRTSRVIDDGCAEVPQHARRSGGAVVLCWHEEVFTAPYVYGRMGLRMHTLVARGAAGDLIAPLCERCGHSVERGGTSRRGSRHRPLAAVRGAVRHLRHQPGGIYGVLVDGPTGPRYRMKPGGTLVARKSGRPVVLVRSWFRRCLRLETWDRAGIPLPFNEIRVYARGPYEPPSDREGREGLERFRARLERELIELAARSYRETGQPCPPELVQAAAGPQLESAPPAAREAAGEGEPEATSLPGTTLSDFG